MAAELITPTDELSGLPLSIAPPPVILQRNRPDVANWHHLYHPHSAPELASLGGQALRNSRVQLVPIRDHNTGPNTYHAMYAGPALPEADDIDTQFALCVFSCAGYVPDKVIDLRAKGGPTVRPITGVERTVFNAAPKPLAVHSRDIEWYRKKQQDQDDAPQLSSNEIRRRLKTHYARQAAFSRNNFRYAYEPVRDFFESYLITDQMLDVKPRFIKKFLTTNDENTRVEMGEILLIRAAVVSTSGLLKTYRQLHKAGSMNRNMPPVPIELVRDKLGSANSRRQLIPKLTLCLEGIIEHGVAAA